MVNDVYAIRMYTFVYFKNSNIQNYLTRGFPGKVIAM